MCNHCSFVRGDAVRLFSSKINGDVRFPAPAVPAARLSRAAPPASAAANLVDETVTEAFNQACLLGDLRAAADLLAMRVSWHERRSYPDEITRRADQIALRRMQGELERRHIMKGVAVR
jgi:hypothetical protein